MGQGHAAGGVVRPKRTVKLGPMPDVCGMDGG